MLRQFYDFEHALETLFGGHFHFYDLPSIFLLLLLIVMVIVHLIKYRRRKKKFEEELEEHIKEIKAHEDEDEDGNYKYLNIPDIEE